MASLPPDVVSGLIEGLTRALDRRGIPFMLIGGQAVLVHGQPRFTEDIDATLGVGPDRLPLVQEVCAELGLTPLPDDVPRFVAETFVLPARHTGSGLRVDLIFSTLPYEAQAIRRAIRIRIGETDVPFASVEDLLIHKLFAGRPRDLEDATGIIRRQEARIDWEYVSAWAREFSEIPGREGLPAAFEQLRRRADE